MDIKNLDSWTKVSEGCYQYAITPTMNYEIFVQTWYHGTRIDIAIASLYMAAEWTIGFEIVFKRDLISREKFVYECLRDAARDYKENVSPA